MNKHSDANSLINTMLGRWEGEEQVSFDPASGQKVQSTGKFENSLSLNGEGIISTYQQFVAGQCTIACVTCLLFNADNSLLVTWLGNTGEPKIYTGSSNGHSFTFASQSIDNSQQVFHYDYTQQERALCTMQMHLADGSKLQLFTGQYQQLK